MNRPLRIAVAGTGFGAAVHLPVLHASPGAQVVAVVGSTPDRARAAAARAGVPVGVADLGVLLDGAVDAVTLALPPVPAHLGARAVLAAGLPLLTEKPVAVTAAAAGQLADLAQGHTAMVDFLFAELTVFRTLRRLLAGQAFGELERVRVQWTMLSRAQERRWWSWKSDAERGGGVLNLLGTHVLHLVEWLFGPVRVLHATLSDAATATFTPAGRRAAEDSAELSLELSDRTPVSVTLCNSVPGTSRHRWEIVGSRSGAVLENSGTDLVDGFTLTVDGVVRDRQAAAGAADGRAHAFGRLAERFLTSAAAGEPGAPSMADGYRVQVLIDQARMLGGTR
ncbi:Gfo/Idh/MocA family oxidoreductase [Kitasatospora sp. MAP5-34]|uniref:Gfo/Idh/MocA family protein n=1 Tax=Kitasatospora sp. MAP5-34 TaxID=3035102 RepID=UPI00247616E7|nr:Gfo/Idh/MocA family oxidoreductase [Kitasatospora sp. MAP5-34]MDH6580537.1 putative dehydrogenase [Kitasatospora sp. MAP5-34]